MEVHLNKPASSWYLEGKECEHLPGETIPGIFSQLLQQNPDLVDRTALMDADSGAIVTFGELSKRANILARVLLKKIEETNLKPRTVTLLLL